MRSRNADIIAGILILGFLAGIGPAAAQNVIDLGVDTVKVSHGHGSGNVELSVTARGDTAIIIHKSPGYDSLRHTRESDLVRTGESITIDADQVIGGDVVSIGGSVTVLGRVHGDAVAIGGEVTVKSGGRIDGDAVAIGGRVNREPGAEIGGQNVGMSFIPAGIFAPHGGQRGPVAILRGISLFILCGFILKMLFVLLIGWAARALAPVNMDQFAHTVADAPWRSLLLGLGAHVVLAIMLVVLSITVIGLVVTIPAGIALIPINAMSLALIAALLGARFGRGRVDDGSARRPWTGSAAIGLALLSVPIILGLLLMGLGGLGTIGALVLLFFGGTVVALAGATGFGSILLTLFDRRHREQPFVPGSGATPPTMPPPPSPAFPADGPSPAPPPMTAPPVAGS